MAFKVFGPCRLTRDIESITTSSGTVIYKGVAASDFGYGDNKDRIFLDFIAFGKKGEVIQRFHKKGDPIILEGELQTERWQDKDGNKREKNSLKVNDFQFSAGKKKAEEREEPKEEEFDGHLPF